MKKINSRNQNGESGKTRVLKKKDENLFCEPTVQNSVRSAGAFFLEFFSAGDRKRERGRNFTEAISKPTKFHFFMASLIKV